MQPYATTEFLLKDPIGYFCACMLFYYKKTQTMISSPFEAIFNEYSNPAFLANMQQVCSCNGFIGIFDAIIALILLWNILNEFQSIKYNFWWKTQHAALWPVCSNYAAVCSNSVFIGILKETGLFIKKHLKW